MKYSTKNTITAALVVTVVAVIIALCITITCVMYSKRMECERRGGIWLKDQTWLGQCVKFDGARTLDL